LWEVGDAIYEIRPDIKRDFVTEYSNDKQRYEDLSGLHRRAAKSEEAGDYDSAINLYNELLLKSKYGFFKLLAESGLYRSMFRNNGET
jgi:hypothetical protein